MSIPILRLNLPLTATCAPSGRAWFTFPTGETAEWGLLNVNLGSHFTVHAVRIITRVGGRNLIGYILRGSDGSLAPDGSLIWEELSGETRQLNQNTRLFEDHFEPRPIRFLEFRNLDIARPY